jgi:hypothetical protein
VLANTSVWLSASTISVTQGSPATSQQCDSVLTCTNTAAELTQCSRAKGTAVWLSAHLHQQPMWPSVCLHLAQHCGSVLICTITVVWLSAHLRHHSSVAQCSPAPTQHRGSVLTCTITTMWLSAHLHQHSGVAHCSPAPAQQRGSVLTCTNNQCDSVLTATTQQCDSVLACTITSV